MQEIHLEIVCSRFHYSARVLIILVLVSSLTCSIK